MDTKERDSVIQLKILNEIADIEAFVSGMTIRIPNVWLTVQEDVPALKQVLLRQHGV